MRVRYYFDPDTESPHILRHGVTESEVEQVLARPAEDRPGREGSRVAIGQTDAGRHLRVIYVPERDGAFVVTACELRGKSLAAFKRRRRKRGG
jgi:hypothetical protein